MVYLLENDKFHIQFTIMCFYSPLFESQDRRQFQKDSFKT